MQEFKAKAKTTQKMTRDGVVETNQATGEQTRKSRRETDDFSGDTAENVTGKAFDRAATERQRHKAKKRRKKAEKEAKKAQEAAGKQASRLQFSDEERTDPELAKYVQKSEKAADRLEAARAKIPKQKRILIEEKMKLLQTDNLGAYLRKMAIDGYIIQLDYSAIKEQTAEIQKVGVNVNQIAKRVNSTGNAYQEDLEEIKGALEKIWQLQRYTLSKLR